MKMKLRKGSWYSKKRGRSMPRWLKCWGMADWMPYVLMEWNVCATLEGNFEKRFGSTLEILSYLDFEIIRYWIYRNYLIIELMIQKLRVAFKIHLYVSTIFKIMPSTLSHFMPLVSFYTPWKHQKTRCFLIFLGGAERSVAWDGLIDVQTYFLKVEQI